MSVHGSLTDAEYWDGFWSGSSNRVITSDDPLYGSNGDFLRMMRAHVGPLISPSVIELGGAGSYRALALAKWCGAKVTLCDFSPIGLQRTRTIFDVNGCQAELVEGDFFEWSSAGRTFDLVTHYGVLEHFGDVAALMELCRVLLAPGGTLLFTMPNMKALGSYFWRNMAPSNWRTHIYHSDRRIRSECASVGLCVVETFHTGSPLLQITRWERENAGTHLLTFGQRAFDRVGTIVPIYHLGWGPVSRYRGFVVREASSPLPSTDVSS